VKSVRRRNGDLTK